MKKYIFNPSALILLAFSLVSCTYLNPFTLNPVVIKSVDYDCNPVSDDRLAILDEKPVVAFGYSGKSKIATKAETNSFGYLSYRRIYNGNLAILDAENVSKTSHSYHSIKNQSKAIRYFGEGDFLRYTDVRESSKKEPIYIYPKIEYNGDKRVFYTRQKKHSFQIKRTVEYIVGVGGVVVAKLYITHRKNGFVVNLYSNLGGGFLPVDESTTDKNIVPRSGYKSHVGYEISDPLKYPNSLQNSFFFIAPNGKAAGRISIDSSLLAGSLIQRYFVDGVFISSSGKRKRPSLPLHLPEEKCGGVAARNQYGYYGKVSEDWHVSQKLEFLKEYPSRKVSQKWDENEPRYDEFKEKDENIFDDQQDIYNQRFIELARKEKYKANSIKNPLKLIKDTNTPTETIELIYAMGLVKKNNYRWYSYNNYFPYVTNPNTPTSVLYSMFGSGKGVQIDDRIAEHPNIDRLLAYKILSSRDRIPIQGLAKNPNTPIEVLEIIKNRRYIVVDGYSNKRY